MANGSSGDFNHPLNRLASTGGTIAHSIRRCFSWWLKELADSLPLGVRRALGSSRLDSELILSDSRVTVRQRQGQAWRIVVEEAIPEFSTRFSDAVTARIGQARLRSAQVAVRLDRKQFLQRVIELPAAAAENLSEVIEFEMDRYTPFKTADVYFDFRVAATDPRTKRMSLDVVVVRREVADRALAFTRALGLEPTQLGIAGNRVEGNLGFDVMPARPERPGRRIRRALVTVLAILFIGFAAAALYLPIRQKQEALAEREARLVEVRAKAQQAKDISAQVDEMLRYIKLIHDQKQGRPTATELLNEITEILPDDTWIQRFRLNGDVLTLSGYSANPSSLIGLLESSAMLAGVQFTGAVRPDPRVGLDTFNLKAAVARREE